MAAPGQPALNTAFQPALKIAILGPESSGKTTLAKALEGALPDALALPEALREFCVQRDRLPTQAEQLELFERQVQREAEAGLHYRYLLCDCPPLQIAVCSELYFKDESLTAPALKHHESYDLSLLTAADFPWQADGWLRDGAHMQAPVQQALEVQLTRFEQNPRAPRILRLSGGAAQRLEHALAAVHSLSLSLKR